MKATYSANAWRTSQTWQTVLVLMGGVTVGLLLLTFLGLPKKWLVVMFGGFSAVLFTAFAAKAKPVLLVFLVIGILVNFDFHLTYVEGYVGVSDGIVIGNFQVCLIMLLLLAFFGARKPHEQRLRLFASTTVPFLFFLLGGIFSFANSPDYTLSLYGLLSWIETFVFYFYIANYIKTRREVNLVLFALQVGMMIQGGVCILQYILKTNFTLNFQVFGGDPYSSVFRSGGVTGSPNYAAPYIAGIVPITLAQFLLLENRREKIFALVALLLGAVGILLTFSRATWVALFIALIPTSFFLMRQGLLKPRHLALALLPVLLLGVAFSGQILSRVGEGAENLDNREVLWNTAFSMIKTHPLLGIGLNTYTHQMSEYMEREMYFNWNYMVHNKYLLIWSETGIVTLLSFIFIIFLGAFGAMRLTQRQDRTIATLGAGLLGGIVVYAVHMNFETYNCCIDVNQYWLLIGLTAALGVMGTTINDDDAPKP